MRRVLGSSGMKPGFWRLKATAGIGMQQIGPYSMFENPEQPTQSRYLSIWITLTIGEITKSKGSS
jgi:hypothetical protein